MSYDEEKTSPTPTFWGGEGDERLEYEDQDDYVERRCPMPDLPAAPMVLDPSQNAALAMASRERIGVITGGPGTGKTTILKAAIEADRALGFLVKLASPTGKAARRLAEATGRPATTIHRLLNWGPAGPRYHALNPLAADRVIIDEASMVDVRLMTLLLAALPYSCRLLLVGDADQLPSVGPGNVLRDLISSGAVPVARLTEVHRQSERSWIHLNAQAINRGEMPRENNDQSDDWMVVEEDMASELASRVTRLITQTFHAYFRKPDGSCYHPLRDFQVLCPKHKGAAGVEVLNSTLQTALNPGRKDRSELAHFGTVFREGDRVMQIKNNYETNVFNGECGFVSEIGAVTEEQSRRFGLKKGDSVVWVEYDPDQDIDTGKLIPRKIPYPRGMLSELVLNYACTIHKSQGSEYPVVILLCHSTDYWMLARQLLYTAVTRARKIVFLVGDRKGLKRAVKNDAPIMRHTRLAELLRAGENPLTPVPHPVHDQNESRPW